jgi:hypothetical protein
MSEHERKAEFLRQCFLCEEGSGHRELEKEFTQVQRKLRCVQRATCLMAFLSGLAVIGLCYLEILLENFPYSAPKFIVNVICALGVGSLLSFLAFAGLGMVYRKKLNQRKETCQTEFLRQCFLYDESNKRQKLEEKITQIQRKAHCVQCVTLLMAVPTAIAVAGICYPGLLLEKLLDRAPQFIVNLIWALGVGSLMSLLAFAGLGMVCRKKLKQRRLECCQMVASLLKSRLPDQPNEGKQRKFA